MPLPVKLQNVVDEMEAGSSDEATAYINVKTGELYTVTDMGFSMDFDAEDEDDEEGGWEREVLEKDAAVEADENFIELPDKHDINEYRIMEDFIESLNDRRLRGVLSQAIQGRGAFRRFKDRIAREGVEDGWFAFRGAALKKTAANFLESEEIPFIDDTAAAAAQDEISDPAAKLVGDLELSLLKPKFRNSWQKTAKLLDDAFVEFGSSGQVFSKANILDALHEEAESGAPKRSLSNLEVRLLAPEVALVTYRATRHASRDAPERHSLRSSVWVLNDGRWQMLFHQGTPATES